MPTPAATPYRHAFFAAQRAPQAVLACGDDVAHLADLDRTYWVILSRPTAIPGREDPVAAALDTDGDGRVRVPDVLAAIAWLKPRLASFDRLFLPFEGLVPEDLRADTPEGKALADFLAKGGAAAVAASGELARVSVLRAGLARFLRNFVNVADLYPPAAEPVFVAGALYLDGRCCRLCVPLAAGADVAAHAAAAAASRCCLAYCALERKGEAGRTVLAVFTAGATGALAVGKRGLFVDGQGRDWDATVTHLEINTISLTEAFFAPWRKIGEACAEMARRLVGGRGEAAAAQVMAVATAQQAGATSAATPAPAAAGASSASRMASVATLGISLSFVASAVAALASAATSAPLWKTGAVVAGIVLAVSLPSVVLAWFRLRNRDLAPILNASGWAVNVPIGLTVRLGHFFTRRARYLGRRLVRAPRVAAR